MYTLTLLIHAPEDADSNNLGFIRLDQVVYSDAALAERIKIIWKWFPKLVSVTVEQTKAGAT